MQWVQSVQRVRFNAAGVSLLGWFVQFDTEAFGEAMSDTRMKLEEAAFFIQGVRSVSGSEFSPRNLTDSVEPNP